jgi:hypothetical protein
MEAKYDQLYGPGTGHQFLTGPYAADVVHAVAVRVQPHLNRAPQREARPVVHTPPPQPSPPITQEGQKMLAAAAAEHWQCIKQAMIEIVPFSAESAETVATAVLTKCGSYEERRIVLAAALFRVERQRIESVFLEIVGEMRKQIIAQIVTFRAQTNRSSTGA